MMPMNVTRFHEIFFSDKSEFGLDAFGKKMDRKEITIDKWTLDERGVPTKWLKSLVPVRGVPFLS